MAPTTKAKISISLDRAVIAEIKELAAGSPLSAIVSDALNVHIKRLRMLELFAEWDREDPISEDDRAAGEALWKAIVSSSTPEPSRRSRRKTGQSASRSRARP